MISRSYSIPSWFWFKGRGNSLTAKPQNRKIWAIAIFGMDLKLAWTMKLGWPVGLCLLIVLISLDPANGQDGHYWTNQYGARSTLLGNSVIGSVTDLGAVYYNPARLVLLKEQGFILSADIYEWNRYKFKDAFGDNSDVSESDFGSVPGFVAGTFRFKKLKGHQFAYSALSRIRSEFDLAYRDQFEVDISDEYEGEENLSSDLRLAHSTKNQWYNLSWSYLLKENLSIGVTMAGARIKSEKINDIGIQVLTQNGMVGQYSYTRDFSFTQYGMYWKFGVSGSKDKYTWGATVTTPILKVAGSGEYYYGEFLSTLDPQGEELYSTIYQDDLEPTYRSPWAFGAGVSTAFKKFRLHLSAEWYTAISQYEIMSSEGHVSQSSGDTLHFSLVDELSHVVNIGLGVEFLLSERVHLYGRFNTDFSAVDSDPNIFLDNDTETSLTSFSSNLYHYGGGVALSFQGADITFGIAHASASQRFSRANDFPEEGDSPIGTTDDSAKFSWSRWQALLGFSFSFLNPVDE